MALGVVRKIPKSAYAAANDGSHIQMIFAPMLVLIGWLRDTSRHTGRVEARLDDPSLQDIQLRLPPAGARRSDR